MFLVAQGLPFKALIGRDTLRRHSAIIDLNSGIVILSSQEYDWAAEIIGNIRAPQHLQSYYVREEFETTLNLQEVKDKNQLWEEKLQEIRSFQTDNL